MKRIALLIAMGVAACGGSNDPAENATAGNSSLAARTEASRLYERSGHCIYGGGATLSGKCQIVGECTRGLSPQCQHAPRGPSVRTHCSPVDMNSPCAF
jgi:hypothetical protein